MSKILLAGLFVGFFAALGHCGSISGTMIDWEAQSASSSPRINVEDMTRFSMQVTYATTTPSASSFTDGALSSATITVTDYDALDGRPSTSTLTLNDGKNTAAIDLAVITINGKTYTEGTDWDRLDTSTMTMNSLATALNAHWEYSATASSNVITLTAYTSGTAANSWTLQSSTYAAITTVTWSNGQAHGWLMLNSVTLTEGTDFDAETSSDTTAGNIADAINADATLSTIVTSTSPTARPGIVEIVAASNGVNRYPITVSNTSHLTPDYPRMENGSSTDIDLTNDTIEESSHGFATGLPVLFAVGAGAAPTGLTDGTTYYAILYDDDNYQLSDTSTGAVAGLDIDITAVTGSGTFTATPISFSAGSMGWKWQGSNDGSNWSDLDVTSVTYTTDGTDLWNFTDYAYKYIRLNYTGPTYGGIQLDAVLFGLD
jgi:hypothetical protein